MNTTLALIFTLPAGSQTILIPLRESVYNHSFRLSLSCTQNTVGEENPPLSIPYPSPPLPFSCLVAQRSICADFLKGLQGVTWTEWMGLIAFSKVEADLYKRKWIECCGGFFSPHPMLPVMYLHHFVKLCHFICFQHFLLFSLTCILLTSEHRHLTVLRGHLGSVTNSLNLSI